MTSACAATVERFPFVPSDPERLQQDCYEAYNIQVSGLEQRLRALNYPKVVIGVSGGLDSTHALIVAARAMDREGRPRSDILAFTLPGFATGERTKGNAIALGKALGVTFEEIDIRDTRHADAHRDGPSVRARREGLRRHVRERAGRPAHRLPVPAGQPARRHRARHRRPVRTRTGLVHLRRRRPDVALQRERRRAEDPDPAPDPVGDLVGSVRRRRRRGAAVGARDRDHPGTGARRARTRRSRAARPRSDRTSLQDFSLYQVLRYGFRPSKIAFLAWHAWSDAERGDWPPGYPPDKRPAVLADGDPALAAGLRAAVLLVQPVQAFGAAQRPEGVLGRGAVAARRLAGAVGHVGADLARRDRA